MSAVRLLLLAFVVLVAACGGSVSDSVDTTTGSTVDQTTTSTAGGSSTTETVDETITTEAPDTTRTTDGIESPNADLPAAPDFTLELGTGGEYTLSSTDNPVYLVFWAEW